MPTFKNGLSNYRNNDKTTLHTYRKFNTYILLYTVEAKLKIGLLFKFLYDYYLQFTLNHYSNNTQAGFYSKILGCDPTIFIT